MFWPLGGPPWEAPWLLGAVLGRSWSLLGHLRSYLEASWAILSHLGAHLGLPEALLEPSWAILDAQTRRGLSRPGPGEGVRGRGKPFPEGEEGGVEGETLSLGCHCALLERFRAVLGLSRGSLGRPWGPLGSTLDPFEGILGCLGVISVISWTVLGDRKLEQSKTSTNFKNQLKIDVFLYPRALLECALEFSLVVLGGPGGFFGRLEAVSGAS